METKKCPFCGETILKQASKCKFCREFLEKEVINEPRGESELARISIVGFIIAVVAFAFLPTPWFWIGLVLAFASLYLSIIGNKRSGRTSAGKKLLHAARIISIITICLALIKGYLNNPIMEPVSSKEIARREYAIVNRLIDIREIQIAHKSRYQRYNASLDSLVWFVNNDSLPRINSWTQDTIDYWIIDTIAWISAKDSIFNKKNYPPDSIPYIPYSRGERFNLEAGFIERGFVTLAVFEAFALPEQYLPDLKKVETNRFIRVGSMVEATTKGNWE